MTPKFLIGQKSKIIFPLYHPLHLNYLY